MTTYRHAGAHPRQGGFAIVSVLVCSVLLTTMLFAAYKMVILRGNSDARLTDYGTAHKSATRSLYELMDLPWSDPKLIPGSHADPDGKLKWEVTAVAGAARLKKITVKQFIVTNSGGTAGGDKRTAETGYKYNDF